MQALEKDPDLRPWMHEILNELWGEANVAETRAWKRPAVIGGGAGVAVASLVAVGMWALLESQTPAVRVTAPRAEQGAVAAPRMTSRPANAGASSTRVEAAVKPPALVTVSTPTAPEASRPAASVPPANVATETARAIPPAAPPPAKVAVLSASAVQVPLSRRTYRVGWLDSGRATVAYQDLVKQALVGYPRDVAFEYRSADGQSGRLKELATELVLLKVDVVFAVGDQAVSAAKQATSTIPIVMLGSDAAGSESTANVTGVTYSSAELARGWLSLLKEIRPPLARVAVVSGSDAASRAELARLQTAAANAGATIKPLGIQDVDAIGSLFAGPPAERAEAIIVPGGSPTLVHLPRIIDLAGRARVPTIYGSSEFVDAGGLLAYGPSTPAMYRRAGAYIGKILGPTNPRDLPLEHPSRYELVVNLKTARALGITLPQSLVLRADRVVQ
jgi:putative ABC transport system substrate-binding protein